MSWTTAVTDIRTLISDGETDKLCWLKQVIGQQDGSNKMFKTFEKRRLTEFVGTSAPTGVYVNNAFATVIDEDLDSGAFTLSSAPANTDLLQATYYYQWFTDAEIEQFLTSAAEWIGVADNYASISQDLRPAAKEYAAGQGFQKLAARFSQNLSETFQLYYAPDQKRFDPATAWLKMADAKIKLAFELRDDVYKNRKGQALAPISGVAVGRVRNVAPNR
jgi:hypothetical protein